MDLYTRRLPHGIVISISRSNNQSVNHQSNSTVLLHAGVVESPEDFESSEDVYEAVGGVLQGAAEGTTEKAVRDLCQQLYSALRGYVYTWSNPWFRIEGP